MPTIEWVYDEFEGPMSGIATYDGKIVWFNRTSIGVPPMVSSTDVPVTHSTSEPAEPEYQLSILSEEVLGMVRTDHVEYCNATGSPLNHGDPIRILSKPIVQRPDLSTMTRDGTIDAHMRPLLHQLQVQRRFPPGSVQGEPVCVVKQSQFTNYYVPRRVEIE